MAFNNDFWRNQDRLERDFPEHKNLVWNRCERRYWCKTQQHRSGQALPCDLECCRDAFGLVLVAGARAIQDFGRFDVLCERAAGNR